MLFFLHTGPTLVWLSPDQRPWIGESFWPLCALLALYLIGVGPLRRYLAPEETLSEAMRPTPFPARQAALFATGLGLLYFSLQNYWLDHVGEKYLFTMHMLQHTIIIFFVPLFLMPGTPDWLIRPFTRLLGVTPLLRLITRPTLTFLLFNAIFAGWHLSGLFEWALRDRTVHFFEHLSFLTAGIIMWWPILSPLEEFPRLSDGGQIVYYFALSISQIPLFFFLAFAGHVYYDTYLNAPRIFDLSPLADQQLGGIVMKIVGEFAFVGGIAVAFSRWYRGERRPLRGHSPVSPKLESTAL